MGMAFTDALIDHSDARVVLVDRREGVGGHWRHAYPFVRLHQSSTFYGVASTVLGGGRIQQRGPEAGLHERADQPTICAYYDDLMADKMLASGRVQFFPGCDYLGAGGFVSPRTGERFEVSRDCRIVDARYLAPDIPAKTPPRFGCPRARGSSRVNDLVEGGEDPSQYVIVGSGKTATDACIWLLTQRGVDPDAICWVRARATRGCSTRVWSSRIPSLLGMAADMMQCGWRADLAATTCSSGWRTQASCCASTAGPRRRWPRRPPSGPGSSTCCAASRTSSASATSTPCDAAGSTSRRGRSGRGRRPGRALRGGGLKNPPRVPIWGPDAITLQPIRAGSLLRGGTCRVRRGDPRGRRRKEPALPALVVRQHAPQWATMNVLGFGPRHPSPPIPTSRPGPTGSRSTPHASHRSTPVRPSWTTCWTDSRPTSRPGSPGSLS